MQDELLDERVANFVADLRSAYGSLPLPPARPGLSTLFATGLTIDKGDRTVTAGSNANGPRSQAAGLPKWGRRRMFKQAMGSLAAKVAAATTGAMLAVGGLGVAGALPGPLHTVASDAADVVGLELPADEEATDPVADQPEGEDPADQVTTPDGEEPVEEGDEGTEGDEEDATPGALAPVPTSTSEAAHIHDFDEACGNHGAYVSHFARTGEEPQCARDARAGAAGGATAQPETGDDEEGDVGAQGRAKAGAKAKANAGTKANAKAKAKSKPKGRPANRGGKGRGK
ncbi:MAG: hypothetical protein M3N31_02700 [Actinomycetota bacterium]|nr:hypothetical protein [Actinomycetota bacterium]